MQFLHDSKPLRSLIAQRLTRLITNTQKAMQLGAAVLGGVEGNRGWTDHSYGQIPVIYPC